MFERIIAQKAGNAQIRLDSGAPLNQRIRAVSIALDVFERQSTVLSSALAEGEHGCHGPANVPGGDSRGGDAGRHETVPEFFGKN